MYLDFPEFVVILSKKTIKYVFLPKQLDLTKTTSKYIAGLQDPFKDRFMNGKSKYKLKSL